jgi:anti-anti-sigma factor
MQQNGRSRGRFRFVGLFFWGRQEYVVPAMPSLQHRVKVDRATAQLICSGRIAYGGEAEELDSVLQELFKETGTVELDLAQVNFLDSSGIGVLVRNLVRARSQRKLLKLTELSDPVRKTLEVTNVLGQFRTSAAPACVRRGLRVLFVHPSAEIRTFAAALLQSRGAQVNTCASMYDARVIATAGETDLLILPGEIESSNGGGSVKTLQLDKDFFEASGEKAAEDLVAKINAVMV